MANVGLSLCLSHFALSLPLLPFLPSLPSPHPSLSSDIKFEDIDESLWKSGMAATHGFDSTGQNVVMLNISMHRKNAKRAPMIRKWIAFCYEMQVRKFWTPMVKRGREKVSLGY
jgi:hypothetical protein